jgi:hypothetical protein
MIQPRAYREQVLSRDALREIFQQRGKTIDESLARLFIDVMGLFAPGTLVQLKTGEIALVTGRGPNLNQPMLAIITNSLQEPLDHPQQVTLQDSKEITAILRIQDHAHLIAGLGRLWPVMSQISPL